jgi:hypothetical protein
MIKVYTGPQGFAASFFFIAGVVFFLSIFFWGSAIAVQWFPPLLVVLSYLLIFVFLFGVLPATFFKDLRPPLGMYSVWMSHTLGFTTWMMSLFYVIKTFGFLGIFLIFSFQYLAPIALIGAILKGPWAIAGHLSIWISFTYGMRRYSEWLLNLNSGNHKKRDIIDVDAIEVRGP